MPIPRHSTLAPPIMHTPHRQEVFNVAALMCISWLHVNGRDLGISCVGCRALANLPIRHTARLHPLAMAPLRAIPLALWFPSMPTQVQLRHDALKMLYAIADMPHVDATCYVPCECQMLCRIGVLCSALIVCSWPLQFAACPYTPCHCACHTGTSL